MALFSAASLVQCCTSHLPRHTLFGPRRSPPPPPPAPGTHPGRSDRPCRPCGAAGPSSRGRSCAAPCLAPSATSAALRFARAPQVHAFHLSRRLPDQGCCRRLVSCGPTIGGARAGWGGGRWGLQGRFGDAGPSGGKCWWRVGGGAAQWSGLRDRAGWTFGMTSGNADVWECRSSTRRAAGCR